MLLRPFTRFRVTDLIFTTGRVPTKVENHRFPYVPRRFHVEASRLKRLFPERWGDCSGGWGACWGRGEERATQNRVSGRGSHSRNDCTLSWVKSTPRWSSCGSHPGTGRGWRRCWGNSLQAERILPMPWCIVWSGRTQQRKSWDTSLNVFPCSTLPSRRRLVCLFTSYHDAVKDFTCAVFDFFSFPQVATLYLVSDVLHNSCAKVAGASYYRK